MKKNVKITPSKLSGTIRVPASKSISHRALICAALANGTSVIDNLWNAMTLPLRSAFCLLWAQGYIKTERKPLLKALLLLIKK